MRAPKWHGYLQLLRYSSKLKEGLRIGDWGFGDLGSLDSAWRKALIIATQWHIPSSSPNWRVRENKLTVQQAVSVCNLGEPVMIWWGVTEGGDITQSPNLCGAM